VPTSRATFTVGRTRDRFDVADWNPGTHGAAPPIVMHGRRPVVMACGFCHLADDHSLLQLGTDAFSQKKN
jgi:hypothetical protein